MLVVVVVVEGLVVGLVSLMLVGVMVMPLVRAEVAALTWLVSFWVWLSTLLLLMILEENSTLGPGGGDGALGGLLGCGLLGFSGSFFSDFSSSCVASSMVCFDSIFFCFTLISSNNMACWAALGFDGTPLGLSFLF